MGRVESSIEVAMLVRVLLFCVAAGSLAAEVNSDLLKAVKDGDEARVAALIGSGADVNAKDADGRTPLMWGCLLGRRNIVDLLLKKGADANAADTLGMTALMLAPADGEIARRLLAAGAQPGRKDSAGWTAGDWAWLESAVNADQRKLALLPPGTQPGKAGPASAPPQPQRARRRTAAMSASSAVAEPAAAAGPRAIIRGVKPTGREEITSSVTVRLGGGDWSIQGATMLAGAGATMSGGCAVGSTFSFEGLVVIDEASLCSEGFQCLYLPREMEGFIVDVRSGTLEFQLSANGLVHTRGAGRVVFPDNSYADFKLPSSEFGTRTFTADEEKERVMLPGRIAAAHVDRRPTIAGSVARAKARFTYDYRLDGDHKRTAADVAVTSAPEDLSPPVRR